MLVGAWLVGGCGHKEGDTHDHGKEQGHTGETGHSHGEEPPSGAWFKAGKGVLLTEETRKILGVEVLDITERELSRQVPFTAQIFGEKHHHILDPLDHSGCDVHGAGFLPTTAVVVVRAGMPVQVFKDTNPPLHGVVLAVQKGLAMGESEIVIGVSNATAVLKPGEFVTARIDLARPEAVAAIPQSAVLRSAEGTFVYVVNGDAYFRTPVKVGAEADGWVEIREGLLAGDQVVLKPVQALWLIELRATKGGGHSH